MNDHNSNNKDRFGFRFREWDIYRDARGFRKFVNSLLKIYPKEERYMQALLLAESLAKRLRRFDAHLLSSARLSSLSLYSHSNVSGIAALPTVIIISLIAVLAGVGIVGSGFIESLVTGGDFESKEALYAAEAGAQDAFKRLARDKNCTCNFTLSVGNASTEVTVTGTNPKTITSLGTRRLKKRKIQVVVSWDTNDEATHTSWKEVAD